MRGYDCIQLGTSCKGLFGLYLDRGAFGLAGEAFWEAGMDFRGGILANLRYNEICMGGQREINETRCSGVSRYLYGKTNSGNVAISL